MDLNKDETWHLTETSHHRNHRQIRSETSSNQPLTNHSAFYLSQATTAYDNFVAYNPNETVVGRHLNRRHPPENEIHVYKISETQKVNPKVVAKKGRFERPTQGSNLRSPAPETDAFPLGQLAE